MRPLTLRNLVEEGAEEIRNSHNEGALPLQPMQVRGRLSQFFGGVEECNHRSLRVKYLSQGIYILRCISQPLLLKTPWRVYILRCISQPLLLKTPWKIRSPQGPQKEQEMLEQISLMLQKNTITEALPDSPGVYSNVFLVHKMSGGGGWRPVIDLKHHFRTSLSYGH